MMEGSEPVDAVVSPPEVAGKFGERHDFEDGYAQRREMLEPRGGSRVGSLRRERPDVQLVHDVPRRGDPAPAGIGPAKRGGIDDLRRTVWSLGLKPGRGIRKAPLAVQSELVSASRTEARHQPGEIAVLVALELGEGAVGFDLDAPALGRPYAKVNASRRRLSTDREASRDLTRDADGHG